MEPAPVIKFHLKKEALEVPCQLTWIADFIPTFEQTAIEKIGTLEDHLKSLVKKSELEKRPLEDCGGLSSSESRRDEAEEDDQQSSSAAGNENTAVAVHPPSPSSTIFFRSLGKKLNKAAFLMYIGDLKSAKEMLEELRKTVSMLSADRKERTEEGYWEAINYCMDASEWQIQFLESLKSGGGKDTKAEDAFLEIKVQLNAKWKKLYLVEHNNKFVACIEFFKGRLGKNLKIVKLEASRNHFNKAAETDKDYHVWSRHIYWELRKDRRKVSPFRDGARGEARQSTQPTEEEGDYCTLSYTLDPDDTFVKFDYAVFLKDQLWDKKVKYWDEHSGQVELCVTLFNVALEDFKLVAVDKKWIELSSTFLAEVLLRRGEESDVQRGKALLEEFPESSAALHKLAKFYRYGLKRDRNRSYIDFDRAEEIYLKALMLRISNYPCLMEYIKFLNPRRKHTQIKIMQVTDMYLDAAKRDHLIIEVLIKRGCLIWSANDGILGSKSWVDVLTKFPTCAERVYSTARALIENEKDDGIVNEEALSDLEKACDRFLEAEEYAKVEVFIHELKTITGRRWPYPDKTGSILAGKFNQGQQQRQRQNWNQPDEVGSSTTGNYNTRTNSRFDHNYNGNPFGNRSSFTATVVGHNQRNSRFQQDRQPLQQLSRSIGDRYHGGGRPQRQKRNLSEADRSDNWRRR